MAEQGAALQPGGDPGRAAGARRARRRDAALPRRARPAGRPRARPCRPSPPASSIPIPSGASAGATGRGSATRSTSASSRRSACRRASPRRPADRPAARGAQVCRRAGAARRAGVRGRLPAADAGGAARGPWFDLPAGACFARASSAVDGAPMSPWGGGSMRSFIRATVLGAVSALALGAAARGQDAGLLLGGQPEGFNPQLFTAGTTFDASSKPVYNRLIEFERGDTKTVPGLAESFTVSDDGLTYTFKLRQGVKWHTTKDFTPTRDFNADDVVFTFDAAARPEPSVPQGLGRHLRILRQHGHDQPARSPSRRSTTIRSSSRWRHRRRRSSPTSPWISPRSCRPNTPTR